MNETNDRQRKHAVIKLYWSELSAAECRTAAERAALAAANADMPSAAARLARLAAKTARLVREIQVERDVLKRQRAPENVTGLAGREAL